MENSIKKLRWFWAWQDEAEEAWLKKMSGSGYHLSRVEFPATYHFIAGTPKNYVYRLDFKPTAKKEQESYMKVISNAGWEHIGEMLGWQYFRIESREDDNPEIISAKASKIKKFRRLLIYLLAVSPLLFFFFGRLAEKDQVDIWMLIKGIAFIIILTYIYAMMSLISRINRLKKR